MRITAPAPWSGHTSSIFKNVYHIIFISCLQSFKAFSVFLEKSRLFHLTQDVLHDPAPQLMLFFFPLAPLAMLVFLSETSHSHISRPLYMLSMKLLSLVN